MGQRFTIKSTEPREHVERVVEYITHQMKKVAKSQKTKSLHDIAILTLLNITDELFKSQVEVGTYKDRVVNKVKNILRLIDVQA